MPRRKPKPKDRTVNLRMKRYRARGKVHERRPIITVGHAITDLMIDLELLDRSELENNPRLGEACEKALQMWVEDRAKWLERHFVTRSLSARRD
jgi:hypothetical protein